LCIVYCIVHNTPYRWLYDKLLYHILSAPNNYWELSKKARSVGGVHGFIITIIYDIEIGFLDSLVYTSIIMPTYMQQFQ